MGGGDSLYEKIDNGVRNAKVIISCITPKYVISANCRREVSLADALKKPIIPLLLDRVSWPPPGPMSLVFTEKLSIDFCISANEPNEERILWNGNKFERLLIKLQEHIPEVNISKSKDLIDMKRPATANIKSTTVANGDQEQPIANVNTYVVVHEQPTLQRPGSAPVNPQSRTCSIM
ncbi:unnamed protein product [Didymodactylos carnosus]|uniref:TIR domain-containing protein n=1 Tax=Didymodactylos carnosus TaxID=1234261 RepID=A0A815I0A3_9BILA|nr:unnamed protein product [Didymodactylos carnosus]CAF4236961.1 unnamed protein product [Didymodactylos carnosus]